MSASFGFVGGVLALTALEAVVSSKGATDNVSGLLGTAAGIIRHLSDPTVPAIPDRRSSSSSSSTPLTTPKAGAAAASTPGATRINPKTGAASALFT